MVNKPIRHENAEKLDKKILWSEFMLPDWEF
jgi:hypothetical protein